MKEKLARKFARKNVVIRQVAVLPYRRSASGQCEVLLLTSRQTSRFVIPKGWPMKGLPNWKAAAVEAKQEAGLTGDVEKKAIGTYRYWKRLKSIFVPITVFVFAMKVTKEKPSWQEKGERTQQWLTGGQAMLLVDEPDLATLIGKFIQQLDEA